MRLHGLTVDLSRPWLVGILNTTPDSFADGGELPTVAAAVDRARALVDAGADMLDIGGESSRPGAEPVSLAEECARVLPAIAAICQAVAVPVSVDTRRAIVAEAALAHGAAMVNDTSGCADAAMAEVVRAAGAAWVLMHMPHALGAGGWSCRVAELSTEVGGAIDQIAADLAATVLLATAAGVAREQLAVDPGIGFGKNVAQNLALLRRQPALATIGLPLYLGPSRKSFLRAVLRGSGGAVPRDRDGATAAAVTAAVLAGAAFVRVHNVAAMRQVIDAATAIRDAFQG